MSKVNNNKKRERGKKARFQEASPWEAGCATYRAVSIFSKVSSACSKKLKTRAFENSRSTSSSSISKIWEKV